MFALEKENECLRNENNNQQPIIEMLIKNRNKNTGTWKTVEKKTSIYNRKINSINYETIALKNSFNAFATSNSEFIEVTEDEEINDKVTTDNNPQKSQPEVKRRHNAAITENYFRSQNILTVPGNRTYASMIKYGKKICIAGDSQIKRA